MTDMLRGAKDIAAAREKNKAVTGTATRDDRDGGERKQGRITMAKIYISSVLPAAAATVWRIIRDFNALPQWVPAVAESRIEQNMATDQVGCVRNFTLKDGGKLRERLLALSDHDLSCTYSILESPMGVDNYIATLSLTPITDGNETFAEWTAEFDAAPDREAFLVQDIGTNVFQAAFTSLKQKLVRGA